MRINKLLNLNKKLERLNKSSLILVEDSRLFCIENKAEFILNFNATHSLGKNRYRFYIYFSVNGRDDYSLTKSFILEGSYKEFYNYYLTFLKEYNKIIEDISLKDRNYFYQLGFSYI